MCGTSWGFMVAFSERVKELRINKGLTQTELGKIIGVVKSTVSLYECGKSYPTTEIMVLMCKHFGVTLDYLVGISDIMSYDSHDNPVYDEIKNIINNAESVFNSENISSLKKEKIMLRLNEIYWNSKRDM